MTGPIGLLFYHVTVLRTFSTFFITTALLIEPAWADVQGRLVDAGSGAPVQGATVIGAPADAADGEGVQSDAAGRFVLRGNPTSITVVDTAHEAVVVDVTMAPEQVISLVARTGEEIIEVTDERAPSATPGAIAINRDTLTALPGARGDVLSGVKNLPGIANNGSLTPLSSGLIIRGSSPQDSRVLVDGFEIPVLYHFLGVQSVIPTEMLSGLDYLPGTFGVQYGRASGGIVDAHIRDEAPKRTSGFAELSFINIAGLVEGPIGKKGSFAVAARRSVIDAVLAAALPSSSGLSFTAYPRYYDYQARGTYRPGDRWRLTAFVFGSDDKVEVASDADNAMDPVASGNFGNATSFTRAIASVRYKREGLETTQAISAYVDTNHFTIGADRFLLLDRTGVATRHLVTWDPSKRLRLQIGGEADVTRTDYNIRFTRPPIEGDLRGPNFTKDALIVAEGSNEFRDLAAWADATVYLTPAIEVELGTRVDAYVRNDDYIPQPRGSLVWRVAEGSSIRAAAGLYSRPPEYLDQGLQANLDPERAVQLSVAAEHRLVDGLTAGATLFDNRFSDLLVLSGDRTVTTSLAGYQNVGRGESKGIELLLKARRDDFFGWLAYTGSIGTRQDGPTMPERRFDYDQAHNLIAVASWEIDSRWRVGGRFQLTTGKPYTPITGAVYQADVDLYDPLYGPTNSQRVATQHQLDLRVDRVWKRRDYKITAYLDVANVYLNAAAIDYRYNFDYTKRTAFTTLPIIPSFGVRGEL